MGIVYLFYVFQHPSLRKGATKIIVNNRGHLSQDINRSARSPWGSFVGTWQMERKPIQLKTRTKLTAHLYGSSVLAGSKSSSRAGSARSPSVAKESEPPMSQSPQPQALQSPKDGSRPNTADSNSSWVIIENAPSHVSSAAVYSRPPSQPKSNMNEGSVPSPPPLAEGSRAQSAVLASRSPTPAGVRQSPSVHSPSVMSAGDDVSLPPTRSNTAASQQQADSRPHSRMGGSSQVQAQPLIAGIGGSRSVSTASQNNLQIVEDAAASPHLIEQ